MLVIDSSAAMVRALDQPIDPDLKYHLALRGSQLADDHHDLGEHVRFVAVAPGDTLDEIEAALGFPVATNLVDGSRLGQPGFTPSWEWAERHRGGWTELAFVLADDFAAVLLVPDRDGIDPTLTGLCRDHAAPVQEQVGPEAA